MYFYKEGYLRTSGSKYSLDDEDLKVHLTNQCFQVKDKETYGQFEDGNTLNFENFQAYLDEEHEGIDIQKHLVPQMKNLIIDTFQAVKNKVNPTQRSGHFELLGYDFMIDEDFKVWLIEVNTGPYLGTPNSWAKKVVPEMLDEMFAITVDPIFSKESVKVNNRE